MQIKKNRVVSLDYRLTKGTEEGNLIEETFGSDPLQFIFGVGMMIPAFEENIEESVAGDELGFAIPAGDAYGEIEEQAIIDVDIQGFAVDGKLDRDAIVVGQQITMQDQDERKHYGVIKKVGIDRVTVDFNHPMAGQDLFFKVKINEVREATESELDHGHVHE